MKIVKYSEWAETHHTVHMLLQMMGKVKLARTPAEPEWGHVVLQPIAQGFSTGLIPNGEKSFDILINFGCSLVYAHCLDGSTAGFPLLDNLSVADYYRDFKRMLQDIGAETDINPTPQEVGCTIPFHQQTQKRKFDHDSALEYFRSSVFVRNALLEFAAPYRGKKILPSLFWGSFDITTVLFSGEHMPFPGEGVIEKVAFDEKFVEFGFWPGDETVDEPSLFVLPYPFTETDYSGAKIRPKEAFFSPEKKEFFLPLADVLRHANPQQVIKNFCKDTFEITAGTEDWKHIEWLTKPL